ncbi:MAG: hypothetical protein IJX99_00940 [Clostridia bacterium]|nr:hypothetical protein [Clostridia bacterium]
MKYLNMEQKNIIWNALQQKQNYLFYMAQSMPQNAKARCMLDHAAATGDLMHVLTHGITFGGIAHQIGRSSRWSSLANSVYNNSVAKGLKAYSNGSEVVVVGKRFISYYAEGESCKKEIYMDKIVKVEGARKSLTITVKDDRNKYHFVTIGDMGGRMAEMIETILFYRMNAMGAEPGVITPFEYAGLKNSFM